MWKYFTLRIISSLLLLFSLKKEPLGPVQAIITLLEKEKKRKTPFLKNPKLPPPSTAAPPPPRLRVASRSFPANRKPELCSQSSSQAKRSIDRASSRPTFAAPSPRLLSIRKPSPSDRVPSLPSSEPEDATRASASPLPSKVDPTRASPSRPELPFRVEPHAGRACPVA
ncbi:hypothetical protein IC582_025178 [Cucumis melo]